jgi:hypothetical protein
MRDLEAAISGVVCVAVNVWRKTALLSGTRALAPSRLRGLFFWKKMVFAVAARVTVDQKKGGDTRVITISSSSGDASAVAAAKATCMISPP